MEIRKEQDVTVIAFPSRLDSLSARDVEAELKDCIEKGAQKLIANFAETEYVSSAGLRVLFGVAKELKKTDGCIVLASLKPYLQELFDTAGFTPFFTFFSSEAEALENLLKK